MQDEDLPAQPPRGISLNLYSHLISVYILGFLESLFGAAVIVVESAAIILFYDPKIDFSLEIAGIFVGLLVFVTGVCNFCAGRNNIDALSRRKLFIVGIIFSLISVAAVGAMLVVSILRTRDLYKDVEDKEGRDKSYYANLPYSLSLEGMRHSAQLSAIVAGTSAFCLAILLGSLFLNCLNVGKNKSNTDSAVVIYARVPKDDLNITS